MSKSNYKREKKIFKNLSNYELLRQATRNQKRADRDLNRFKATRKPEDKRYHDLHRARAYRARKALSKRLNQKIGVHELDALKGKPSVLRAKERYREKRKEQRKVKTIFKRTIKAKRGKRTKKGTVEIKFKDRKSLRKFTDQVEKGFILLPRDEREMFTYDEKKDEFDVWDLINLTSES